MKDHLLISNTGLCYSNYVNRLLKLQLVGPDGAKYYSVGYKKSGKTKHLKIHRQVAILFIANPEKLKVVNHLDGDKLNNNRNNLEWTDNSGNAMHAVSTGLNPKRGQDNQNAKLRNSQIKVLKKLHKSGVKQQIIANKFNVTQSAVSRIVNNKTYINI